jgi:hypothetical protein
VLETAAQDWALAVSTGGDAALTADHTGPLDAQPGDIGQSDPLWEFSPYPPIADYAFLSDCEVTALVAPGGSVEWMCLPRLDCPSVFGALLDRDAGCFRLGPEDMTVPADRRYLPGTMVLETSWDCGEGWLASALCRGAAGHRRKTTRRPTSERTGPPTTGSTGWRADASLITAGAATSPAVR